MKARLMKEEIKPRKCINQAKFMKTQFFNFLMQNVKMKSTLPLSLTNTMSKIQSYEKQKRLFLSLRCTNVFVLFLSLTCTNLSVLFLLL